MATVVKGSASRDAVIEAVLDAADRLFRERPITDVSLRTIAESAGVTYSLVNRHLGSKDALFEQLMARYRERWLARLGDDATYDDAFDLMLGDSSDSSAYLRLLASSLLSDANRGAGEAHRRHHTLDRIPGMRDDVAADAAGTDAGVDTAAALALIYGWRFFAPVIREALHLGDMPDHELHEQIRARMRAVAHFTDGDASA
jgi:AcrR family transcriptional regulator